MGRSVFTPYYYLFNLCTYKFVLPRRYYIMTFLLYDNNYYYNIDFFVSSTSLKTIEISVFKNQSMQESSIK